MSKKILYGAIDVSMLKALAMESFVSPFGRDEREIGHENSDELKMVMRRLFRGEVDRYTHTDGGWRFDTECLFKEFTFESRAYSAFTLDFIAMNGNGRGTSILSTRIDPGSEGKPQFAFLSDRFDGERIRGMCLSSGASEKCGHHEPFKQAFIVKPSVRALDLIIGCAGKLDDGNSPITSLYGVYLGKGGSNGR